MGMVGAGASLLDRTDPSDQSDQKTYFVGNALTWLSGRSCQRTSWRVNGDLSRQFNNVHSLTNP